MNVRTAVAEPASVHQELSFTDAMFQKYKSDGLNVKYDAEKRNTFNFRPCWISPLPLTHTPELSPQIQ